MRRTLAGAGNWIEPRKCLGVRLAVAGNWIDHVLAEGATRIELIANGHHPALEQGVVQRWSNLAVPRQQLVDEINTTALADAAVQPGQKCTYLLVACEGHDQVARLFLDVPTSTAPAREEDQLLGAPIGHHQGTLRAIVIDGPRRRGHRTIDVVYVRCICGWQSSALLPSPDLQWSAENGLGKGAAQHRAYGIWKRHIEGDGLQIFQVL